MIVKSNSQSKTLNSDLRIRPFGFRGTSDAPGLIYGFCTLLFALTCSTVAAQQPAKMPRVAFLGTASASIVARRLDALRQGLRELGYIEGQNIVVENRF